MSKTQEPSYRTAYRENGTFLCPETGRDLSEWSADSIRAHAQDLFPDYASDNFSDEAKERKETLLAMAKAKEQK